MKKIEFVSFAAVAFVFVSSVVADSPKSYTLPGGTVLENPVVLSRTPDALEVGHSQGIMTVRFEELPADVQKKFNYDPAKAETYRKSREASKKVKEQKQIDDARKEQVIREEIQARTAKLRQDELEKDIAETELRIRFLKDEIGKLEKSMSDLNEKSAKLAGTSVSNGNCSTWRGGYWYSSDNDSAGQRAENTKRKTINKFGDQYVKDRKELEKYKKELYRKELDLISLNDRAKATGKPAQGGDTLANP